MMYTRLFSEGEIAEKAVFMLIYAPRYKYFSQYSSCCLFFFTEDIENGDEDEEDQDMVANGKV